jgi:hypothetical protein
MAVEGKIVLTLLVAYQLGCSILLALRPPARRRKEILFLILYFLFPPILWLASARGLASAVTGRKGADSWLVASIMTFLNLTLFVGLLGVGIDRRSHSSWFYWFLGAYWLVQPVVLLLSRGFVREENDPQPAGAHDR